MLCFLFWAGSAKSQEYGRPVRPVSWEAPETPLSPHYVALTPEYKAWLDRYCDPVFIAGYDEYKNVLRLLEIVGYWPEPIDIPIDPIPADFYDDEVPF